MGKLMQRFFPAVIVLAKMMQLTVSTGNQHWAGAAGILTLAAPFAARKIASLCGSSNKTQRKIDLLINATVKTVNVFALGLLFSTLFSPSVGIAVGSLLAAASLTLLWCQGNMRLMANPSIQWKSA